MKAADGGTLKIEDDVSNYGTLESRGGGSLLSMPDATLDNFAGVFATDHGAIKFDHATVTNETDATIEATHHGKITFDHSQVVNDGLLLIDHGGEVVFYHSQFDDYGDVHVASGGELLFEYSSGYNYLNNSDDNSGDDSAGGTITFDHSYLDNQGQIGGGDNIFNFDFSCVDNEYQLKADSGGTITFRSSYVDNTGALAVGACSAIYVDNSTINNVNGTITISGHDSLLQLSDATIKGGTIDLGQEISQSITEVSVPGLENYGPIISGNGEFIAFNAGPILPDNNSQSDGVIELYDTVNHSLTDISALVPNADLHAGETFDSLPSVSATGQYVVFEGDYQFTDVNGYTYDTSEVFLYNSQAPVSQQVTLLQSNAYQPVISGDGQFVAMQGGDYGESVLVTDLSGNILTTISGDPSYTPPPNGQTNIGNVGSVNEAAISSTGQFVSFWSTSPEIVVNGTTFDTGNSVGAAQVYVYDRQNNTLQMVSVNNNGQEGNNNSGALTLADGTEQWTSSLSANGTYVVFQSSATNLVAGSGTGSPNAASSIFNEASNVYLYDTQTHTIALVSAGLDGTAANGASYFPTISADGTYVTFESTASNLVAGGSGGQAQTYVYDTQTGAISLVSATVDGMPADNESDLGNAVSDNGSVIAFGSLADNLVPATPISTSSTRSRRRREPLTSPAIPPSRMVRPSRAARSTSSTTRRSRSMT
jgi:hypothetical protein